MRMSELIEICKSLRTGLEQVRVANQTRQEIAALQIRKKEWEALITQRKTILEKAKIVDVEILSAESVVQTNSAIASLVSTAREKLENGLNVQSLSEENLWTKLTSLAASSNAAIETTTKNIWAQFVDSLGHVDTPNELESRMLKTPANMTLIEQYKLHFNRYQSAFRSRLPESLEAKSAIESMVSTLNDFRSQLQSNAPDSVKTFLKAVDSGGAQIELVTTEVLEWLKSNDDVNRFVVKSKSTSTWR
jgi:hypothetical protein